MGTFGVSALNPLLLDGTSDELPVVCNEDGGTLDEIESSEEEEEGECGSDDEEEGSSVDSDVTKEYEDKVIEMDWFTGEYNVPDVDFGGKEEVEDGGGGENAKGVARVNTDVELGEVLTDAIEVTFDAEEEEEVIVDAEVVEEVEVEGDCMQFVYSIEDE